MRPTAMSLPKATAKKKTRRRKLPSKWEQVELTEQTLKNAVAAFVGMAIRWMYAQAKVDPAVKPWVDAVELDVATNVQKITDSLGVLPYLVNRILDGESQLQAQVDAIRVALVIRDIEEKKAEKPPKARGAGDWASILNTKLQDWSLSLDDSSIQGVAVVLASRKRGDDWRSSFLQAIEPRLPRAHISRRRIDDLLRALRGKAVRSGRIKTPSDVYAGLFYPPSPAEYLSFVSSCMSPNDAPLRAMLKEYFKRPRK